MSSPCHMSEAEFEKEGYLYEDYNDQYIADEEYYNMMDMDFVPKRYMYKDYDNQYTADEDDENNYEEDDEDDF